MVAQSQAQARAPLFGSRTRNMQESCCKVHVSVSL
jgi:hypothetical protein